jgi:sirohydrochlorin ferrochelatase
MAAHRTKKTRDKKALLLIAHGSRQHAANDDLHYLAAAARARRRYALVQASFLEMAKPTIDEAAANCVGQGARRVVLLPYFLSEGVHVLRDLKAARVRLSRRFPGVEFNLADPLGRHPLLLDIVLERAAEADGPVRKRSSRRARRLPPHP